MSASHLPSSSGPSSFGSSSVPELSVLRERLARAGQSHLLNFYDRLDAAGQRSLLTQIASLDLEVLPRLVEAYVKQKPAFALASDVKPAPYFPRKASQADGMTRLRHDEAKARSAGEALLSAGKVGAFVVAGGQGSRLGFEGPKGCFPAGAVTGKSLFQGFAEQLLAAERRYGRPVPWYVMTSPLNHSATVAFFEKHSFFGLSSRNVMFFPQGVLPSLDISSGKVLLAGPGEIATNPDGHGGSIKALQASGALADMQRRRVEHLSYFQVDNPHVRILDPVFLGLHASAPESSREMSSKMIPKAYAEEKLGVFCAVPAADGQGSAANAGSKTNSKIVVIEYSDLPAALQAEKLADGTLRFLAGSIAIHVISVEFIHRMNHDPAFDLPYHRAEKKIPCIDPQTGDPITPASNNGVKLERFVFDALDFCTGSILYETDRLEEFAPIKNATGVDSVESSKQLQTERAARWLEAAGVSVPRTSDHQPDCVLEISPLTAMDASELAARLASDLKGLKIARGERRAI